MNKKIVCTISAALLLASCGTVPQETPAETQDFSEETSSVTSESTITTENTSASTNPSSEIKNETVTTLEMTDESATDISVQATLSEDELKKLAEENIQGYLNCFVYDDFDGDGLNEAFAIAGDTANGDDDWWDDGICSRVYFVNNSGNVSLIKDKLLGDYFWTDREKIVQFGNKKFFTFSSTAGGSGVEAYIFGVRGDMCTEPDISASEGKIYSSFYTGKDGKVYAEDDSFILSGGGRQFFEHFVEYDEGKDEFTIVENSGLANARKYAKLVIDNEDVWLKEIKECGSDVLFCGFEDLDNDNVPEFAVMCGKYGAHGAEGYRFYRFNGDKMVPFRSEVANCREYDDPVQFFTWRDHETDPMNYIYEKKNVYIGDSYCSAIFFVKDRQTGNVRYITADRDGTIYDTYYSLTEYTFENGVIKGDSLAVCVYYNDDKTEKYTFYEGEYDGGSEDKEITKEDFIEIYDSLFDSDRNSITTDYLWMYIDPMYSNGIEAEQSYESMTYEQKIHVFMSDYIVGLNIDPESYVHTYNGTVYSCECSQLDAVLPFADLIKELKK